MGVRLIISDACIGLAESAAEFFPDAAWCLVEMHRTLVSQHFQPCPVDHGSQCRAPLSPNQSAKNSGHFRGA
jgi:hypothetical protein